MKVMTQALGDADGVIANTAAARTALLAAIPAMHGLRVTTIPNGYDEADFDGPFEPMPREPDKFYLVHTGGFRGDTLYHYQGLLGRLKKAVHFSPEPLDPSGQTPVHLFRAIRLLRQRRDPVADLLRVVLVGSLGADDQRCVREAGLGETVMMTGRLPHRDSIRWVRSADALFLPLHGLPSGRRSLIVPG